MIKQIRQSPGRFFQLFIGSVIAALSLISSAQAAQRYLVTITPQASPAAQAQIETFLSLRNLKTSQQQLSAAHLHSRWKLKSYHHALKGFRVDFDTVSDKKVYEILKKIPGVAVEEDGIVSFSSELHGAVPKPMGSPGSQVLSTGFKRMGLDQFLNVWTPESTQSPLERRKIDVDIAILDTGVGNRDQAGHITHPDLNIYQSKSFVGKDGTDWSGHGTHVAGIAAALDNDIGVVGVAPGARIWSAQIFGATDGIWSQIIDGMEWVAEHSDEIEVANASFGNSGDSKSPRAAMQAAVRGLISKGVVLVNSVGNNTRDIRGLDGVLDTADDELPAALAESMTVTALDDKDGKPGKDDRIWTGSNFSRNNHLEPFVSSPGAAIDVCAPGVEILSTYKDGQLAIDTGTSMAAPHVAGLAALYISAHGKPTDAAGVYAIRQALIDSAQPQSEWGSSNTFDRDGNKEPLARPTTAWLTPESSAPVPVPTQITSMKLIPNQGMEIRFPTRNGMFYVLEASESVSTTSGENSEGTFFPIAYLAGNGGEAIVTDANYFEEKRFYRIQTTAIQLEPAVPGITSQVTRPDGSIEIHLSTTPGKTYSVQFTQGGIQAQSASPTVYWVLEELPGTGGDAVVIDPNPRRESRIYRATSTRY